MGMGVALGTNENGNGNGHSSNGNGHQTFSEHILYVKNKIPTGSVNSLLFLRSNLQ